MPKGVDLSTIRSKKQLAATLSAECPWCKSDHDQESPLIINLGLVKIRYNVFEKPSRDMFIIHTVKHVSRRELTKEEAFQLIQAEIWLLDNWHWEIQGCSIIHRVNGLNCNASSVPDKHYFKMLVAPDGTGSPVYETLFKDNSLEAVARRKERAENFFK
ncbi:MAG: hypothetical protein WC848_03585 [Parcubacteria group bacterium]